MKKIHKIDIGVLAIGLAVVVSSLSQIFSSTHAANTLTNTSAQVINVATTDGLPPNGTYISYGGSSSDGNVILFTSNATNLPGAGSSTYGLYVYNVKGNTTARVDVSTGGVSANGNAISLKGVAFRISETGRYVSFISEATNLIDGATATLNHYAIFRRDLQAETTVQLSDSRLISGYPDNYDRNLSISNDGRFVLLASRYIASSYPYKYQMALGDNVSGTYSWTSLAQGSTNEGSGGSDNTLGSMSCDGAFIAHNQAYTVNLVDVRRGGVTIIDEAGSKSTSPIVSCNGRYVLYATTNRTKITPTPSGMNSDLHLVRYDRITGERIYVDSNSSGVFSSGFGLSSWPGEPQENAFSASIADTGDIVFKYGSGGNVYLKHLSDGSGTLEPVAMNLSGTYVNSTNGSITRNGDYIFLNVDPYDLGLSPSSSSKQIVRVKTNL